MAGKAGSLKGVALISGGGANSPVAGALHFVQDPSTGHTEVRGRVTGLAPGLHGFHIHAFGDTTNGCNSTGPHFNPHNKSHGAPVDDERHVGDLGNIQANKDGIAEIFIKDIQISLSGPHSILGRAVVVHADSDDLGKGGHELSKSTGNAGARIGCGKCQPLFRFRIYYRKESDRNGSTKPTRAQISPLRTYDSVTL